MHQLLNSMSGAVLRLLQHEFEPFDVAQLLFDPFGLVAHDPDPTLWLKVAGARQDAFHEGGPCQGLQNLGKGAFHARAFSCGQNGDGEHEHTSRSAGIYRDLLTQPSTAGDLWFSDRGGCNWVAGSRHGPAVGCSPSVAARC